jgi:hypothetical protein
MLCPRYHDFLLEETELNNFSAPSCRPCRPPCFIMLMTKLRIIRPSHLRFFSDDSTIRLHSRLSINEPSGSTIILLFDLSLYRFK